VAVVPPVLLLPWLPSLAAHPSLVLLEPGLPGPGLTDAHLAALALFLLHPGGPGMYPLLLTVGVYAYWLLGLEHRRTPYEGAKLLAISAMSKRHTPDR
jgi:hypothetical protein